MDGILSPAEVGHLTLLRAMVDPDAKEALKASIEQILKVQAEAEAALRDLREQEAKNADILKEANKKLSEAAEMAAGAEALRRELAVKEKAMAEASDALSAEKASFGEVRSQVESGHKAAAADLAERERRVREREDAVTIREKGAELRENETALAGARLGKALAKIREAMTGLGDDAL